MVTTILNGHLVEPHTQQAGGEHFTPDATHSNYVLLQCHDRLDSGQRQLLEEHHVQVLNFLVDATYLCRYEPIELERIRRMPFVVYANVYHPDLVVSHGLKSKLTVTSQQPGSPQSASDPAPVHEVLIMLHPEHGVPILSIRDNIADLLDVSPALFSVSAVRNRLAAMLSAGQIRRISAVEEVQSIEEILPARLQSQCVMKDIKMPQQQPGLSSSGANKAQNQTIAIADGGIDDTHPAFNYRNTRRVTLRSFRANPNSSDANADRDGHGTSIAATAAGHYKSIVYAENFKLVTSAAPMAKIRFQTVFEKDSTDRVSLSAEVKNAQGLWGVLDDAYRNEARVQNISWGALDTSTSAQIPTQPSYDNRATDVDEFVLANTDFVVVIAAGNDGEVQTDTKAQIGTTAAAKNAIVVGATESSQPSLMEDSNADDEGGSKWSIQGIHSTDVETLEGLSDVAIEGLPTRITTSSSCGPLKNCHRVKPDVVAPGAAVISARAGGDNAIWKYDRLGDVISKEASALVNGAGPMVWPLEDGAPVTITRDNDKLSLFAQGSSVSCAVVSGCCAFIRECFHPDSPSAALVKAILVNGASDISSSQQRQGRLNGSAPTSTLPDNVQGFGLVNMVRSIRCIRDNKRGVVRDVKPDKTKTEPEIIPITLSDAPATTTGLKFQRRLTITMSYIDLAAALGTGELVNQLHLSVKAVDNGQSVVKFGNGANTQADLNNNTQKLIWTGITGQATAVVTFDRLPPTDGRNFAIAYYVDYVVADEGQPDLVKQMVVNLGPKRLQNQLEMFYDTCDSTEAAVAKLDGWLTMAMKKTGLIS